MPTLADKFAELSPDAQRRVHFVLGRHALEKWRDYCTANPVMHYVESVCGTDQSVDVSLPDDAFACAERACDDRQVAKRYREPIAAMQDDDLEIPETMAFAFYAIYNLFNKYAKNEPVDAWLIVNQSLSSEQGEPLWRALLELAIKDGK